MNQTPEDPIPDRPSTPGRDWLVAIFLTESAALMIALVTPITPSKTGSDWSMAELFWLEPTYTQKVGVGFVVVNLLLLVIALVAWIAIKLKSPEDS